MNIASLAKGTRIQRGHVRNVFDLRHRTLHSSILFNSTPPPPLPVRALIYYRRRGLTARYVSACGVHSRDLERTRGGFVLFRDNGSCTTIKFGDHPTVELKSWGHCEFWSLQFFIPCHFSRVWGLSAADAGKGLGSMVRKRGALP